MAKILICGASSFVAYGFVQRLEANGYEVEVFSRGHHSQREGNIIRGNYLTIERNDYLSDEYYAVVNFAVLKNQSLDDNVLYMNSLLAMCKAKCVKKLIHFSSIMVYNYHLGKIDENTSIDTVANTLMEGYGKIKIAVDEYINRVVQNMPFEIVLVRPGYVLAANRQVPFIKHLFRGVNVLLGNKNSKQPIVRREDVHDALVKIIQEEKNLPVYHLFQNRDITKYQFAKETVEGTIIILPKVIFEKIPWLMMKIRLIKPALYSRFDGMYNYNVASSELTEKKLNMKFK